MNGTRILGIAGSLRKGSYNRLALQAAQELVPDGVQRFDESGRLGDEPTRQLIRGLLVSLVQLARNTASNVK
jgi:NAD(P)H-dependent FMN reductase